MNNARSLSVLMLSSLVFATGCNDKNSDILSDGGKDEIENTVPENTAKPNILLIVTDQQSYNTISAYANQGFYAKNYFSTPNLDRLVNDGISFINTYCSNPVSVPSRFSLFTGKYGGAYKIRENNSSEADEAEVRSLLSTNAMGTVFSKGGYETVYGGKVHLPFSGKSGGSKFAAPEGYGFEKYLTDDERDVLADVVSDFIRNRKSNEKPLLLVASFLNPHDICLVSSSMTDHTKLEEESKEEVRRQVEELYAELENNPGVEDNIPLPENIEGHTYDEFKNKNNLFYQATKKTKDYTDDDWRKYRWCYQKLVSIVDNYIGKLLDAVDENEDFKKNTIIVFTSDHGEMQGAHKMTTKSLPFEECQRVPFIFSGCGIEHRFDNLPVCNGVDLIPTLCGLAGIEAPECDGVSLAERIKKPEYGIEREMIYIESEQFVTVVDDNYKYTWYDAVKNPGAYTETETLTDLNENPGELMDIKKVDKVLMQHYKEWIINNHNK